MSRTVLQSVAVDPNPGTPSASTVTATFANPTTAGSSFYLAWTYSAAAAVTEAVSDTQNGAWPTSYTEHGIDTTNATLVGHARIDNTAGGAAPTVTLTLGSAKTYKALLLLEISGPDGGGASGLHAGQFQSGAGAGADAVTSGGVASTTAAPSLVVGVSMDTGDVHPPAAGTGFASGGNTWGFEFAPPFMRWETKAIAAGVAGAAATFTRGAADPYATLVAVFSEVATAAAPPLGTQRRVKGFPPRAPLPGIGQLGRGVFASSVGSAVLVGSAAGDSTATATLTLSGAPTLMAQPQPMALRFGVARGLMPRPTLLGSGILAAGGIATSSQISGSAAGDSTVSAALLANGVAVASVAGLASSSADLLGSDALAASVTGLASTAAGLLGGDALVASATGLATTAASALGSAALVAAAAGLATTSAGLLGSDALVASASGDSTTSALLTVGGAGPALPARPQPMARRFGPALVVPPGFPRIGAGITVPSQTAAQLTGAAAGDSTATATLTATDVLVASATGVASTTAGLLAPGALASVVVGLSSTSAALLGSDALAAAPVGLATTSAGLLGTGALEAAVTGVATAVLSTTAAASIVGVATATGTLLANGAAVASATGAASCVPGLNGSGVCVAGATGLATTSAALIGASGLAASATAVASCTAGLLGTAALVASATGLATATLATGGSIGAAVSGDSAATGTLTASGAAVGAVVADSIATAALTGSAAIIASALGVSSAVATLLANGALFGSATGLSAASLMSEIVFARAPVGRRSPPRDTRSSGRHSRPRKA